MMVDYRMASLNTQDIQQSYPVLAMYYLIKWPLSFNFLRMTLGCSLCLLSCRERRGNLGQVERMVIRAQVGYLV